VLPDLRDPEGANDGGANPDFAKPAPRSLRSNSPAPTPIDQNPRNCPLNP